MFCPSWSWTIICFINRFTSLCKNLFNLLEFLAMLDSKKWCSWHRKASVKNSSKLNKFLHSEVNLLIQHISGITIIVELHWFTFDRINIFFISNDGRSVVGFIYILDSCIISKILGKQGKVNWIKMNEIRKQRCGFNRF